MYERNLDKEHQPDTTEIKRFIGNENHDRLMALLEELNKHYDLQKELRFPFGNTYGWGYKISHKKTHLCYLFFEKGAFSLMVQIGDKQIANLELVYDRLSSKAKVEWKDRYPCGEIGGWVNHRVLDDADINDVLLLIQAKKAYVYDK